MEESKTSGLKEVTSEIVGWDDKIVRTLKHLTTKPADVVSSYCRGEKRYMSPVVYILGVNAIETFIASRIGLLDFMLHKNLESLKESPVFSKADIEQIASNLSFFISETGQKIIIIPLLLLFTWLFYKKFNKSFKENSWFAFFILGHATLLSIPFMLKWYFAGDVTVYTIVTFIGVFGYWVWASMKFYNLTLGKAILLRLLMMLVVIVTLNIGVVVMMLSVILSSK